MRRFTELFARPVVVDQKAEDEVSGVSDPSSWLFDLFGATPTASNISVTPSSAMRVPAVKSCVDLISGAIATLPCKTFVELDEGGKEADKAHPSYRLVHDDANDWTSAGELRRQLASDAMLFGAGFAYANRVNGRVVELLRLTPGTVTVKIDERTGEPRFHSGDGKGRKIYSLRDILWIQAPGGIATIHQAREAIALAIVLEQRAAALFAKGGRPSGTLEHPQKLSKEGAERMKAAWAASHAGENAGGTALLEEGLTFKPLTFSSVDAQFAEMRRFQLEEVARAFRVPPNMIGEMGRATWSNSEEGNRQFLQFTLLPWLETFTAAYRRLLLAPAERASHSIEFVVDDLLRADTATRAAAYASLRSSGCLTANEIRRLENLPAIPGGDSLDNPFTNTGAAPQRAGNAEEGA